MRGARPLAEREAGVPGAQQALPGCYDIEGSTDLGGIGQRTVTNFATAWSSDSSGFTNAKWWEVIMQHESFFFLPQNTISGLRIFSCTQSYYSYSLSFTTGK
mgnify:CR=1 FL=1